MLFIQILYSNLQTMGLIDTLYRIISLMIDNFGNSSVVSWIIVLANKPYFALNVDDSNQSHTIEKIK